MLYLPFENFSFLCVNSSFLALTLPFCLRNYFSFLTVQADKKMNKLSFYLYKSVLSSSFLKHCFLLLVFCCRFCFILLHTKVRNNIIVFLFNIVKCSIILAYIMVPVLYFFWCNICILSFKKKNYFQND
jgi:hypothetical protein